MLNSSYKRDCNDLAVKACLEYIRASDKYTLENYFKENDLLKGMVMQGNNTKIPCPFHPDSDPSLSADFNRDIFKCFSCGKGGGYLKFVELYNNIVLGKETNFYLVLEDILRHDLAMRTTIKYNSIFIKDRKFTIKDKFVMFKPSIDEMEAGPQTYVELANRMKRKRNLKTNDIILMVSLMQQGLAPTEIYNQIFDTQLKSMIEEFNIDEIIGG